MTTATTHIPGYIAGTWDIDPVHSDVSFSVRHMMVSKVRGRFASVSGEIVTGADVTGSGVTATIDASSIDTGNEQRDGGGVVVSDKVQINLEIEGVLRAA